MFQATFLFNETIPFSLTNQNQSLWFSSFNNYSIIEEKLIDFPFFLSKMQSCIKIFIFDNCLLYIVLVWNWRMKIWYNYIINQILKSYNFSSINDFGVLQFYNGLILNGSICENEPLFFEICEIIGICKFQNFYNLLCDNIIPEIGIYLKKLGLNSEINVTISKQILYEYTNISNLNIILDIYEDNLVII